ncbi:Vacuolar protein sorting-associated protein 33A [Coccomyxa sp. Obi]|nr:Vacuolar protein sorting-associated protein 33A [Coccomyxa sp. Obi]
MSALPDYNEGPLSLGKLREEARRLLIELLDSRRGKKVLILDPRVSGFLGLLAEVSLLKEHGIEQLLHLSCEPLGDLGVRNVIYLVRASIDNAQHIAQQIKDTNRTRPGAGLEYAVYFLPRRTIACERIFQEEGVYGDIVAGEFPLGFIPFDYDLLSLEQGSAFRELVAEGDRSSLYGVARALTRLQALYGGAAVLKGKGPMAAAVRSLLLRMRQELGPEAPVVGGGPIDEIILLDREVDAVTPMCTQLTYEGLVDETMQIKNGSVSVDNPSGVRQKIALNSADKVFRDLRDLSFAAVGPQLGQRAKSIQSDYKTSKAAERSLSELKEFAAQLKALPNIQRHIGLAEAVNRAIAAPAFRTRVSVEQSLLDGHGLDASAESIEEMMCNEEDLFVVLRLMCLMSLTQGGVPKKYFDALRKEVLHSYGHEYMLLLSKLQDAGLLVKQEGGKGNFAALKRAFRLLVDDVDDKTPTDIAYVFSGYAPLSVRMVEAAVKGPGWGVGEEVLRLLPGPSFEVEQTTDDKGLPIEKPVQDRKLTGVSRKRRVIVVVFIGGVTFAEIAALRFVGSRPEVNCTFVTATTKLINGTSLLENIVDDSITAAKNVAVL